MKLLLKWAGALLHTWLLLVVSFLLAPFILGKEVWAQHKKEEQAMIDKTNEQFRRIYIHNGSQRRNN